ncbi:MAG: tape measure protein, partial [Bacteroides sp.]
MAKLYFKVGSDVDKVIQLRQEIAKLKQELMSMDVNKAPAAAKALETQIGSASQEMRGLVSTAAQAGATMENDFKKKIFDSSKVVNTLSQKIIDQRVVIRDASIEVKNLTEAYRSMNKSDPNRIGIHNELNAKRKSLDNEKNALFGLQTEQGNARLSVKKLKDEYASFNVESNKTVESNNESSISFGKVMAAIGGAAALKRLGSEIIRVRGEFQSMQTAIETLVGKDMAGNLIPQIKELAKVSPLTLSDMVGAEKMMLGFNIKAEDTIRYLQALGDISMGDSQKFNSLTLAFSQMSATGKLMGQDLNQMINAGFNPLQQIAQSTGKSIATLKEEMSKGAISTEMVQKAFIDATSAGGKFFGMSENASKTINGQLSMMEDAMDASFNKIGTQSQNLIMTGTQGATYLIENYETIGKVLVGLIGTYGTYKAATIAYYAMTKTYGIYDIATKEMQFAATMKNVVATNAMIIKQKLLNATMLKNPYVLIATLVIGAAAAMWALHDGTTAAEKAQNSYNEKVEKAAKIEQEHKQKLEELISELQNEVTAETRKMKILDEIKRGYPQMFKFFIDEKGHVKDLTKAWKEYNEVTSKKKAKDNKRNVSDLKKSISEQKRFLALNDMDLGDRQKNISSSYSDKLIWNKYNGKGTSNIKEKIESDERELWTWEKVVRDDELTKWKV